MLARPHVEHPNCQKCGLFENAQSPFMAMDGNFTEEILFIGEAPGAEEDVKGIPFVGKSGKYLRRFAGELGVSCAYTNALRCRPPNNKPPTVRQQKYCRPFLDSDIIQSPARVIVLLGNTPLKSITNRSGITEWRGRVLHKEWGDVERTIIPTFHPAYLLRGVRLEDKQLWVQDLGHAANIVEGVRPKPADHDFTYLLVDTVEKAEEMFEHLRRVGRCAFDLEFDSLKAFQPHNRILVASFAVEKTAYALPLLHPEAPFSHEELYRVLDMFEEFVTDPEMLKVGANIKIDALITRTGLGCRLEGVDGDVGLMSRVLNSMPGRHGLKTLAAKHLNMWDYENTLQAYIEDHGDADPDVGGTYANIPLEILWLYAAKDAAVTLLIEPILHEALNETERTVYYEIVIPLIEVFTDMEANGCKPDLAVYEEYFALYKGKQDDVLQALRNFPEVRLLERERNAELLERVGVSDAKTLEEAVELRLERVEAEQATAEDVDKVSMQALKDVERLRNRWQFYNPHPSSPQSRRVLYGPTEEGYLGFEPIFFTPTGAPSVNAEALQNIDHPIATTLKAWRMYAGAIDNILKPFPEWIGYDGKIRSEYGIGFARSHRVTSKEPNLQNIHRPDRYPGTLLESHPLKNLLTYSFEGGGLMQMDLSQIELRVLACASRCPTMITMFEEGRDIHAMTAAQMAGIPESEVTKTQRSNAKSVNFGIPYGISPAGLMREHGFTRKEADDLMGRWFMLFPEALAYQQECIAFAEKHGYVLSPFGRKRYLPFIRNAPDAQRSAEKRSAINHPIQCGAGDILYMGMVVVHKIMKDHGFQSRMVNTVHDSVVYDYHPDELDQLVELNFEVFPNLPLYIEEHFPTVDFSWFVVPLDIDIEIGTHYGSLSAYEVKERVA